MSDLRIIFMGTAELSVASLQELARTAGFQVVAVVTQPDRPRGRDMKLQASTVKAAAVAAGLPVLQPERARSPDFIAELAKLLPDLIVVVAYGQILPQAILDLPKHGCLNVHTSLLPKYRGAAPIQWAILDGEPVTGVTIMKMDAGLDTGDIVSLEETVISDNDTAATLHDRLGAIGARLLARTIPDYVAGTIQPRPQPAEGSTYARKITKADGRLDWSRPAKELWNRVRGLTPWPGAYTQLQTAAQPQTLKIWRVEVSEGAGEPGRVIRADKQGIVVGCGAGALKILELQREGGKRLAAGDFLAGCPINPGRQLG